MGYIPHTKQQLVKELHDKTGYTYKEIEEVYKKELTKFPSRNKYYARKHAIKVLQGRLSKELY